MCKTLAGTIRATMEKNQNCKHLNAYAIPRGGVPVAYVLQQFMNIQVVINPADADFFIDDIIDSGETMRKYCDAFPGKPFYALIDKTDPTTPLKYDWVQFPWEVAQDGADESGTDIVTRLLQFVGEDTTRGGLIETPARVVKAWRHWTQGYTKDPEQILKVFEDGGEGYDEMVIVKDIPFYSHCEHHMAPFFGTVSIAYIPDGKIVGLSKLSRLVQMFAQRLQVQERMTKQIADTLKEHLAPKGVGVYVKARHLCMESRGICQQGHHTVTSALNGVIESDASTRNEFIQLLTK